MNENLKRMEGENFLQYSKRLIKNRESYDLDKSEVYELLYGEKVSSDHARKALKTLELTIEESEKYNIENIHKELNDNDLEQQYKQKNTIELNKDGSQTSDKLLVMSEEDCKDVNYLLKAHGYDINAWELVSARNNIWNVYSKTDGVSTLYSSKIVVKPRIDFVWTEENAVKIFDSLKSKKVNKNSIKPLQYKDNGNILVVPIADFHYGLYSDKMSTGNEYNTEIAEELFYDTLNDIILRNQHNQFEKVVFVLGNDLTNADNLNNTTTKGTPQDNCDSWFSIVEKVTQIVVDGIDMLSCIAPVDVVYVPSNHDMHTTFGIMQTLKAYYKDDENVNIDTSPMLRKYYKYGNTLLALSHDIKVKEALKIISSEAKAEWSDSTHIVCMLAHLHQSMIYDKQGYLEILRLPTISGWSRWTNSMGYIQSDKKNQSFIINKELGILDTMNTVFNLE